MTAREIDIHTLPSMLTALRLPSFHKLWAEIATRADSEGWPAARFLAVLAEYKLAERDMTRIIPTAFRADSAGSLHALSEMIHCQRGKGGFYGGYHHTKRPDGGRTSRGRGEMQ